MTILSNREALRAIADGHTVQCQGEFNDSWHDHTQGFNPISNPEVKWRLKPDPAEMAFNEWWKSADIPDVDEGVAEDSFKAGWSNAIAYQAAKK